ncbi:MAG TPA: lactonase family protein [Bryobacterales bacterium]|nr:lactonase family protein [Bryobacterales bacterium]
MTRRFLVWMTVVAAAAPVAWSAPKAAAKDYWVYVGTYTGPSTSGKGIYVYRFSAATGKLSGGTLAAETSNPTFLAVHPSERYLYAANENSANKGAVTAYAIDAATGKLTLLNEVSSRGSGPCYVSVDHTGKNVLVANYNSGSVAVLPVKEDGSLSEASAFVQHRGAGANPKRQKGPHAHWIEVSPDNRFALAADLGLDEVVIYKFDAAKGSLTPNDPPFGKVAPGAGPRHVVFHPSGKFVYVIDEMASTVTAFAWDARRGALKELQAISTLPEGFTGNNTGAEIEVSRNGKFLYGSNRGHDSIAVFAIDAAKGTLTAVEQAPTQGHEPRNFAIDPSGRYLFAENQRSDTIVLLHIDAKTGKLTPAGDAVPNPAPVCIKFVAVK